MSEESKTQDLGDELKSKIEKIINKGAKVIQHSEETIESAINAALSLRENVVMVRVNKESLKNLDELVDVGLFKSRSESAAFLIREGIKSREDIFGKISEKVGEINKLKDDLKNIISSEFTANKVDEED